MIQQTTLESYESIRPELSDRQMLVYSAIKVLGEATNLRISKHLNLPINSITPRVLELRKLGCVISNGIIMQDTGRSAIVWCVV